MNAEVKILLVEDNAGDALLIKEALKDSTYKDAQLFTATSLADAAKFSGENILLVLLDLSLPDSDGLETVKKIHKFLPDSALIILTGVDNENIAIETLREGAQNYLNKNEIDNGFLDKTIRFSLERHQIIQKLQKAEKELGQSKFFLEKAQEVAQMGSWVADLINETATWSDEAQRIFGFVPGEFDGRASTFFSMVHPEDVELLNERIKEALSKKKLFEFTHRIIRKDGIKRWVHSQAEAVFNDSGVPIQFIGSIHDITGIKEAEEKIIKANRLYSFISHINQTIVHVKDEHALFEAACRISVEQGKFKMGWIGIAEPEIRKINLVASSGADENDINMLTDYTYDVNGPIDKVLLGDIDYYVVNDIQKEAGISWQRYAVKRGFNSVISLSIKRSGNVIGAFCICSSEINFFDTEEIRMLTEAAENISFALDVFEKEKLRFFAEKALKHNEARLNEAQAIAHIGNWELSFFTGIALWSEEACRIYGLSIEEKDKQSYESWISFIHPDDLDSVLKINADAQKTLQNASINHRIIRKDGTVRDVLSESIFEFNENGKPIGLHGVVYDETERKNAERIREKITADIIQRNKDLEQFTYIVSHNLRLPVANIIGIADILKNHKLDKKDQMQFMNGMITSVTKLDEVVRDLNDVLQVRKNIHEKMEIVRFSELTESIRNSIQNIIEKENIKINMDFSAIDEITTLRSYLYSVFYNLISNSIKYRRKDSPLIIELESGIKGDQLILSFKDNGSGIDLTKYKDQIFGLYKRFHSKIEGKGMGLFMVKTQVETLGGKISVESMVNVGTKFTIKLKKRTSN